MTEKNKVTAELMDRLAQQALSTRQTNTQYILGKPGEMIENLGLLKRKILSELKSEDIQNVRWPRV
jgi:hypothetical protein